MNRWREAAQVLMFMGEIEIFRFSNNVEVLKYITCTVNQYEQRKKF